MQNSTPPRRPRLRGRAARDHYTALLVEHRASGLSLRAFAANRGLSAWTLYRWRSRLAQEDGGPSVQEESSGSPEPAALVAVDVVDSADCSQRQHRPFELQFVDGCQLRVPPGFDAGELARLLEVLRSC